PSASLIAPTRSASRPSSRLITVDLPTPDDPTRATVEAGTRYGCRLSRPPSPESATALIATTSTPGRRDAIDPRSPPASPARSDLLTTTTGTAPPSQTIVR